MDIALADGMLIRTAGPRNGRTLLFIHALADCGLAFTPLFETALADNFRLIAVDLPGFGASTSAASASSPRAGGVPLPISMRSAKRPTTCSPFR